ncbi:hypothetical protein B0H13DRAFT_1093679 [Mycena leptocephala]|nr:hypothetical protein B0H13DRAFT_1093679 [Mycena leptocephala]
MESPRHQVGRVPGLRVGHPAQPGSKTLRVLHSPFVSIPRYSCFLHKFTCTGAAFILPSHVPHTARNLFSRSGSCGAGQTSRCNGIVQIPHFQHSPLHGGAVPVVSTASRSTGIWPLRAVHSLSASHTSRALPLCCSLGGRLSGRVSCAGQPSLHLYQLLSHVVRREMHLGRRGTSTDRRYGWVPRDCHCGRAWRNAHAVQPLRELLHVHLHRALLLIIFHSCLDRDLRNVIQRLHHPLPVARHVPRCDPQYDGNARWNAYTPSLSFPAPAADTASLTRTVKSTIGATRSSPTSTYSLASASISILIPPSSAIS